MLLLAFACSRRMLWFQLLILAIYGSGLICLFEYLVVYFNHRMDSSWMLYVTTIPMWVLLLVLFGAFFHQHKRTHSIRSWFGSGACSTLLSLAIAFVCSIVSVTVFVNVLNKNNTASALLSSSETVLCQIDDQLILGMFAKDVRPQFLHVSNINSSIPQPNACLAPRIQNQQLVSVVTGACCRDSYLCMDDMPVSDVYDTNFQEIFPHLNWTEIAGKYNNIMGNQILKVVNFTQAWLSHVTGTIETEKAHWSEVYNVLLRILNKPPNYQAIIQASNGIKDTLESRSFAAWSCLFAGPLFWFVSLFIMSLLSLCYCIK
jgi:hypothetical protein